MEPSQSCNTGLKSNLVTSVPASPSGDAITSNSAMAWSVFAHKPYPHQRADKPKDSRQKREGDISLPLLTSAILCDVAPVEDIATIKRADELFPKSAMKILCSGFLHLRRRADRRRQSRGRRRRCRWASG